MQLEVKPRMFPLVVGVAGGLFVIMLSLLMLAARLHKTESLKKVWSLYGAA